MKKIRGEIIWFRDARRLNTEAMQDSIGKKRGPGRGTGTRGPGRGTARNGDPDGAPQKPGPRNGDLAGGTKNGPPEIEETGPRIYGAPNGARGGAKKNWSPAPPRVAGRGGDF